MKFALTIPGITGGPLQIQVPSGVPSGPGAFENVLQLIFALLFIGAVLLAIGYFILAGVRMIILGDKKEELSKIKNMLAFIILGLVVVFLAFFVVKIISYMFGVELVK